MLSSRACQAARGPLGSPRQAIFRLCRVDRPKTCRIRDCITVSAPASDFVTRHERCLRFLSEQGTLLQQERRNMSALGRVVRFHCSKLRVTISASHFWHISSYHRPQRRPAHCDERPRLRLTYSQKNLKSRLNRYATCYCFS